jgi:hypothetical protein
LGAKFHTMETQIKEGKNLEIFFKENENSKKEMAKK